MNANGEAEVIRHGIIWVDSRRNVSKSIQDVSEQMERTLT